MQITSKETEMENKKLTRSNNRMLAGVCAGLADYFGWDVTIVRIIYSFATVFTAFSGIIVYIILWIVMPEKKYRDGYEDRMNDRPSCHPSMTSHSRKASGQLRS